MVFGSCATLQLPSLLHNGCMRSRPCEAMSVEGFVQQLACNLINHGYWFYHLGRVPEHKDAVAIDEKLSQLYETSLDKFARARRKRKGLANAAYIRLGRDFVLIVTEGAHRLGADHKLKDVRRQPIVMHGYSIGCGKGSDGQYHSSVRIGNDAWKDVICYFTGVAFRRPEETLAKELQQIRFVPYARVRRQLLKLLRLINEKRAAAGLSALPTSSLALKRSIVSVFEAYNAASPLRAETPTTVIPRTTRRKASLTIA